MLGGALANELVRSGHAVVGLLHREGEIRGNDRQLLASEPYRDALPGPGRVGMLIGDITQPNLGLDRAVLDSLRARIDCVIHCAALVRFEADFEHLREVNVVGACHVAEAFAEARLVHVSTAYSCGLNDGAIAEAPHDCGGEFANGYERSKALAEAELLRIRRDAIVVRPSIIVGEYQDGRIRGYDTIYRAFKLIAEGRIDALPVAEDATLNFVPIDHVVAGITALVGRSALERPAIVHLAAREAISALDFLSLIGRLECLVSPDVLPFSDPSSTPRNMAMRGIQPYLSYFGRSPRFETRRSEQITGLAAPVMDETAMLRQIMFCIADGYIRPRQRMSG